MALRLMMMASGFVVNPTALSIYNKLTSGGEWFRLDSAGSTITGAHSSKVATKIGSGATSVVSGGVDFTPDALYRVATADLPFIITNNSKISLCGWVSADSLATVSPFILGDGTQSASSSRALQGFFMSDGSVKSRAGDTSSFFDANTPTSTVSTATTYFLQLRRLANKVEVRINNGTWYETTITADSCPNGNQALSIGGDYSTTSPATTHANQFNGIIGDVLIHGDNTATLTDTEFDYLYNGGTRITYNDLKTAAGY